MNASKIYLQSLTARYKGKFMRLSYEKHLKHINLIEVKHNSLMKQQQRQQIKHKTKIKK